MIKVLLIFFITFATSATFQTLPINTPLTLEDSLCDGDDCLNMQYSAETDTCVAGTRGTWQWTFMHISGIRREDCYLKIQSSSAGAIFSIEKLTKTRERACGHVYKIQKMLGGWFSVAGLILQGYGMNGNPCGDEVVLAMNRKIHF